jgi:hypothetical protein
MLRALWQIQRFDKNTQILESRANVSRSLLRNFLDQLYSQMKNVAMSHTSTTVLGAAHTYSGAYPVHLCLVQADGYSYVYPSSSTTLYTGDNVGIQIGEGTGDVGYTEYQLVSQHFHGTASDEILYSGGTVYDVEVSGAYSYFDFERIFKYVGGSSIVIKELGIAVFMSSYSYLICRDVLELEEDWVTVYDGEYLKVTYRIRVTT